MPLYEYRCRKCGRRREKIQKFSDPPLATCEACGGRLERLLSAPAIQFKGSGWYVTDYARKPGTAEASETSQKGESPSAGSTGGSPDTKAKKTPEPAPAKKPSHK